MRELLPQECAPVDDGQRHLSTVHLLPVVDGLRTSLLALRRELDPVLAPPAARIGKDYPLGCCEEITVAALQRLRPALARPRDPALAALAGFVAGGGRVRHIWGVLRERYFQNALQVGALYVDVANDTVDASKSPVEILPFEEAGIVSLRGPEHFARIAATYWGADTFANHAVPDLAPLLPIITHVPGREPQLQSATDYMTDLFRRDGFVSAETWLAEGPSPPPPVIEALRRRWVAAVGSRASAPGLVPAVEACRAARAADAHRDMRWRDERLAEYVRAFG